MRVGDGLALQVARPLGEVDHTLHRLGLYMLFIGLGGDRASPSGLGLLVGSAALRPVGQLTSVAEEVTADPRPLPPHRRPVRDELGRLASAFNAMLVALDAS